MNKMQLAVTAWIVAAVVGCGTKHAEGSSTVQSADGSDSTTVFHNGTLGLTNDTEILRFIRNDISPVSLRVVELQLVGLGGRDCSFAAAHMWYGETVTDRSTGEKTLYWQPLTESSIEPGYWFDQTSPTFSTNQIRIEFDTVRSGSADCQVTVNGSPYGVRSASINGG